MRLQVEPLRPCGELLAAGAAAEDLALDKLCVGAAGRELLERFTHAGAAGGRKEDDGLAGEVIAFRILACGRRKGKTRRWYLLNRGHPYPREPMKI